jgi:hypothetical protein
MQIAAWFFKLIQINYYVLTSVPPSHIDHNILY